MYATVCIWRAEVSSLFTVSSEAQNQQTLPSTGFLFDLSCWHLKLHGDTGGNEKMDEVNRCFLISNLFCTNKSN